jgi:arsenite methyltransferase
VLKPGGRFAVSDVVVRGHVPASIKKNMELWVGCVAGALSDDEYLEKLAGAGVENVSMEPTRVYSIEDASGFLSGRGLDADALAGEVEGKFISAFIRASKLATACCVPGCCSFPLHRKFCSEPDGRRITQA